MGYAEGIYDTPIRERILRQGLEITLGNRNKSYGDPLFNHQVIAQLRQAFWSGMARSGKKVEQNTAFGAAMDAALTNIGRIAASPSTHLDWDRFMDGANYLAIACEVGMRTENGEV